MRRSIIFSQELTHSHPHKWRWEDALNYCVCSDMIMKDKHRQKIFQWQSCICLFILEICNTKSSSKHLSTSLQQNKSFTMVKINTQWLIEHPFRLSHILVTCHSTYLYKERCFAAHNNVWIESKKECIWQSAFCSLIFYLLESIVMICS